MTEIGKDVFFNFIILDEKIEVTKQSLKLTQHLQFEEHLLTINIMSASNLDDCHVWLHLYNSTTKKWDKVIDLDKKLIVTPANMDYVNYMNEIGDIISSTEHPTYFKAISTIMTRDISNLLRKFREKFS